MLRLLSWYRLERGVTTYAPLLALFILSLLTPSLQAGDNRVEAQLAEPPPPIPLVKVLGEEGFNTAVTSGKYRYAGNNKCRLCHREFFLGRKQDKHDYAFEALVENKQDKNPRCLGCHTTGYGWEIGFVDVQTTPKLRNVQCEGCHGPGNIHIDKREKGGLLVGTDQPELLKKMCHACHTDRWNRSFHDLEATYPKYRNPIPD